ncbi:hypothetical protein T01_15995 [Trichinella spiralis]|uniref:Uncharacterized protein n=1 Tax=Trichinella spiralis TaxID=6334 RepID=A0A0V1BD15_TRISP|nr:hypothetical protein T01_15995 [Trichinella spiralis]
MAKKFRIPKFNHSRSLSTEFQLDGFPVNDKKSAMNIARRFPVEYSSGYPVKMGSTRTCYERQYFIFGAHLFHICWVVGLNL